MRPPTLHETARLGGLTLSNRIVMAPMTRSRAHPDGRCGPGARLYYAQRATAGLIVTEGVCVSPEAVGNPGVPGIWSQAHVDSWRPVVEAVHARGGRIAMQLWHTGRASHPSMQPGRRPAVGPSPIAIRGEAFTHLGRVPHVAPRPLATNELPRIVRDFALAARNARHAGFDAVEIHGANGYLIDQFLQDSANRRSDAYGGPIENRARLLFEIVEAVSAVWGSDRVGVRLSPSSTFQDMRDSDPRALFAHVLERLDRARVGFVHLVEPGIDGDDDIEPPPVVLDSAWARLHYTGPLVACGNYEAGRASQAVASRRVDAVAFGRAFLANPDLPERLAIGAPLNEAVRATFFGGDHRGYLDYPSLAAERLYAKLRQGRESLPIGVGPLNPNTAEPDWPLAWAVQRLREDHREAA